jgi:hypothetical protein
MGRFTTDSKAIRSGWDNSDEKCGLHTTEIASRRGFQVPHRWSSALGCTMSEIALTTGVRTSHDPSDFSCSDGPRNGIDRRGRMARLAKLASSLRVLRGSGAVRRHRRTDHAFRPSPPGHQKTAPFLGHAGRERRPCRRRFSDMEDDLAPIIGTHDKLAIAGFNVEVSRALAWALEHGALRDGRCPMARLNNATKSEVIARHRASCAATPKRRHHPSLSSRRDKGEPGVRLLCAADSTLIDGAGLRTRRAGRLWPQRCCSCPTSPCIRRRRRTTRHCACAIQSRARRARPRHGSDRT